MRMKRQGEKKYDLKRVCVCVCVPSLLRGDIRRGVEFPLMEAENTLSSISGASVGQRGA